MKNRKPYKNIKELNEGVKFMLLKRKVKKFLYDLKFKYLYNEGMKKNPNDPWGEEDWDE